MEGQTTLLADEQLPSAPAPLYLHSRHHAALMVVSLEDRAVVIEHLAKKAKDEGYHRIARELTADVEMIKEDLLPEVREQREIPLAGPDEATGAIANYLRPSLRRALASKENDEAMLDRLAKRLLPVLERAYGKGLMMGLAMRQDDPHLQLVRAIHAAANDPDVPT